jgi:hypothetical protein
MAQRLEEGSNSECRDDDGNVVILVDDSSEQELQCEDKTKVDKGKDGGQCAIN